MAARLCRFESCSGHKKRLMFTSVFFCARRAPVSDPSPGPFPGRGVWSLCSEWIWIHMRRRISFAFQEIYITFAISLSVLTKLRQASIPKWMSVFLNCYRGEVVIARSQLFLHIVNTQLMKTRTRCTFVIISIRAEIVRLARIKVIALLRFGKIERA